MILIAIILVLLVLGGGYGYNSNWNGGQFGGLLGTVLVIALVLWLCGFLR